MFPLISTGLIEVAGDGYDPDAQAVISAIQATGITLSTNQKEACNNRILDFKLYEIWEELIAYYGFLGGTAGSHAINWKSPGAYDITWHGTISHSVQGVQSGGGYGDSSGYGDTGYNLASGLISTGGHLGIYSRTNLSGDVCDIGALESYESGASPQYRNWGLFTKYSDNNHYYNVAEGYDAFSSVSSLGSILTTHSPSKQITTIKNGAIAHQQTISQSVDVSLINANLWICNRSNTGISIPYYFYLNASTRQYASVHFGKDLTPEQAIAFSTSEQAYQTALGRQV
jgi:hypothetical protein